MSEKNLPVKWKEIATKAVIIPSSFFGILMLTHKCYDSYQRKQINEEIREKVKRDMDHMDNYLKNHPINIPFKP